MKEYMETDVRYTKRFRVTKAAIGTLLSYATIVTTAVTAALLVGCGIFSTPSTEIKPASSDVSITTTTEITVTPPGHGKETK